MASVVLMSLIPVAAAQGPRGGAPDTAAHNGNISHPGHVQIFTVPNNNFGAGNFGYPKCCINGFLPNNPAAAPGFGQPPRIFNGHRRHNFRNGFGNGFGGPVYAVPYYYGPDFVNSVDDSMEENYAPGPTIFDRNASSRGSIDYERNYDERLRHLERQMDQAEARDDNRYSPPAPDPTPAPDPKATTLVYRNGHTEEVKNYAIVGDTLFDFTTDGRRRISLYDLDLRATQRVNDEHGVDFRLPVRASD